MPFTKRKRGIAGPVSNEENARILKMKKSGYKYEEIAQKLGRSKGVVGAAIKKEKDKVGDEFFDVKAEKNWII
jgi:IS30 family transposase